MAALESYFEDNDTLEKVSVQYKSRFFVFADVYIMTG